MKKLYQLVLILIVFLYGIFTGYREIFPFEHLQQVKRLVLGVTKGDPSKYRNRDISQLEHVDKERIESPLVFVTYGQSNSESYSQIGYETSENVYMFLDGKTFAWDAPLYPSESKFISRLSKENKKSKSKKK